MGTESLLNPINENTVDYEKDKHVDIHNLHQEWLRQPSLCGTYNKLLAQAEKDRDKAKEKVYVCKANLEKEKAKLEIDIRSNPDKYNPPKKENGQPNVTEGWISSSVLIESGVNKDCEKAVNELRTAQKELIEANYKVNAYTAGTKMTIDRKAALEHNTFLWAKGYYAVPNIPRPLLEDFQDIPSESHDDAVENLRKNMQKKDDNESQSEKPTTRKRRGI